MSLPYLIEPAGTPGAAIEIDRTLLGVTLSVATERTETVALTRDEAELLAAALQEILGGIR